MYRILIILTLAFMTVASESLVYSMIIHLVMGEWRLSGAMAALVGFGPVAAAALGGLLLGRIQDLYGRRTGMILSMGVLTLFSLLTGLSQAPLWLGLSRIGTGLALGGVWTAAMSLLGESWPGSSRGRALAVLQMGFPLGYICAAVITSLAVPSLGWRGVFFVNSVVALVELVAVVLLVPESRVWRESRKRAAVRRDFSGLGALLSTARDRWLVVYTSLISFIGMYGYWSVMTWVPTLLREAGFVQESVPGLMVLILLGALVGYPAFGFLGDRIGRRAAFQLFFAGMGLSLAVLGLLVWVRAPAGGVGGATVVSIGIALAFFSGYFSGYGAYYAELFPTSVRGVALGFCFNIGRLGSAVGPVISGALLPHLGVGGAIATAGIGFLLATALVRRLPETGVGVLKADC